MSDYKAEVLQFRDSSLSFPVDILLRSLVGDVVVHTNVQTGVTTDSTGRVWAWPYPTFNANHLMACQDVAATQTMEHANV